MERNASENSIDVLLNASIINIDKPSGVTSRSVDESIKELFDCRKVGHAGTLDKNATGVLIVALNEGVKIISVLMGLDKEYEGIIHFHRNIELEKIEECIEKHFVGEITQLPPVKSRVARKPRKRTVHNFQVFEKSENDVKFGIEVQAGTYIRKLVSDLGMKLGVGAHLKGLKRTRVGHYIIQNSFKIEDVQRAVKNKDEKKLRKILLPIEDAIPHLKKVYVNNYGMQRVLHGAPLWQKHILEKESGIRLNENIGIFSPEKKLVALGTFKRLNNIKIDRVIHRK